MKFKRWIIGLASVIALALAGQATMAFSLRDLLGLGDDESEERAGAPGELMDAPADAAAAGALPAGANWGKPSEGAAAVPFDLGNLRKVLEGAEPSQRSAVLADDATFKRFVQREADAASLLQAARANNLQQDPAVAFAMQRSADNVLREVYLNRLVASKMPAGFPTEEQMRKYFEDNKTRLVIPERIQVWQVYLPFEKGMDAKAKSALEQKAAALARDLAENRISFAEAAQKYSKHEASRQKGGDMGLVAVTELKEEIKQPLMALAEGEISAPVKTDAGIHILKRGTRTPSQPLEYAAIKDQLRQIMVTQARAQLQNAILEQARKSYPVEINEKKVEELRLRLRTDLAGREKTAAAANP